MVQGTQLLIHTVDETINVTFICLVTNALGTNQANVTILVRERPREKSQEGSTIYIILASVILFVVFLVFLLIYLCRRKNSRRNQYSPTANGMVSYSAVASNSQDPSTEGTR